MKCKNCIHWKKHEPEGKNNYLLFAGDCDSEKFIYSEELNFGEKPQDDMMEYGDFEGYSASFYTGPEFGCIHFKAK